MLPSAQNFSARTECSSRLASLMAHEICRVKRFKKGINETTLNHYTSMHFEQLHFSVAVKVHTSLWLRTVNSMRAGVRVLAVCSYFASRN